MTELEMLQAFGEIVDEKINKALEPVKQDLTSVRADVSDLKDRMASVEGRLSNVEGQLTSMDGRLSNVEGQLTTMDGRLSNVEGQLTTMDGRFANVEGQLTTMDGRLTAVETQTADLSRDMRDVKRDVWRMGEELRRVALTQENEVLPKLQLIYENQTQIIDEHREMDRLDTVWSVLKDDVDALKFIAQDNTKEIQRLKQAL